MEGVCRDVIRCLVFGMLISIAMASVCTKDGFFGDNCDYECHCDGGKPCDKQTGVCPDYKCASGWSGEYCQRGNVAQGKPSQQSTTWSRQTAHYGNDGTASTLFANCANTLYQSQPWWKVDLGKVYVIFRVVLLNSGGDVRTCRRTVKGEEYRGSVSTTSGNRYTCKDWSSTIMWANKVPSGSSNYCRNPDNSPEPWCYTTSSSKRWDHCDIPLCQQLHSFKLWVDSKEYYNYQGTTSYATYHTIGFQSPPVGRHIKIEQTKQSSLTLCELQMEAFQYRACTDKRYGPNCNNRCRCANDAKCDDKTGKCPSGCNDRFTGPYCNIETPSVSMQGSTPTSIRVQWNYTRPHDSAFDAGTIRQYDLIHSTGPSKSYPTPGPGVITTNLTNLGPSQKYSFRVQVTYHTSKGGNVKGPQGPESEFQTESCAGYLTSPKVTIVSNKLDMKLAWPKRATLSIKIEAPRMMTACFKQYDVKFKAVDERDFRTMANSGLQFNLTQLLPYTDYEFAAIVRSPDDKEKVGEPATEITEEDVPAAPTVDETDTDQSSISVKVIPPDPPYGNITEYTVEIWQNNGNNNRKNNRTSIQLRPDNLTYTFHDLMVGAEYQIRAKAFAAKGAGDWSTVKSVVTGEKAPESSAVGLIVGSTVGGFIVILVIVILLAMIVIRKKRRKNDATDRRPIDNGDGLHSIGLAEDDDECGIGKAMSASNQMVAYANIPDHHIQISDLATYVKAIKGERSADIKDEYEMLPVKLSKPTTHAKKPENIALNRYKNIVAYDHSRVVLQPAAGETRDYINASYVDGYDKKRAYIASHGPLKQTVTDMWRMIVQEGCTTVVMLTNLVEKKTIKCEQYWPEKGEQTYGPYTVQLMDKCTCTDYIKRVFKVSDQSGEVKYVKQFHFTAWPDHGVPKFACSLLNFRVNVLNEAEYGKAPILVHCSAGVGRTGTFISIDYLIRQGQAERKVSFYNCVLALRDQRPEMVQNMGQYMHVHEAILEYFKIGITYVSSAAFPEVYSTMIQPIKGKDSCKLRNQYSLLEAFSEPITPSDQAIKHSSKNRSPDILPDNTSRVVLSIPVRGWDDYVNAVYLTGYGGKDSYIVTQTPFPESTKDIWRMVADTGISTIVMMNVIDDTYEISPVYWPNAGSSVEFGPLVVEGLNVDVSSADVTVRDFRISSGSGKGKTPVGDRLVRQFQLQNWPEGQTIPSSPTAVIELLGMVEKWLPKVENKTILVHCMDGASQSGVFCVAHSVIEKVKVDHEVDVFQYLRLLRTSRPQLVNTYEQYKFIHEVVLQYLQAFETYANFV